MHPFFHKQKKVTKKNEENQKSPLRINLLDFAENQFPNLHYFSFEFLTIIFCFTFSFMINIQQHFSSNNFCLSVFLQHFLIFFLCVVLASFFRERVELCKEKFLDTFNIFIRHLKNFLEWLLTTVSVEKTHFHTLSSEYSESWMP